MQELRKLCSNGLLYGKQDSIGCGTACGSEVLQIAAAGVGIMTCEGFVAVRKHHREWNSAQCMPGRDKGWLYEEQQQHIDVRNCSELRKKPLCWADQHH